MPCTASLTLARTYGQKKKVGIGKQRAAVQLTQFFISSFRSNQSSENHNKASIGSRGVSDQE
jgi:hypothetical protein